MSQIAERLVEPAPVEDRPLEPDSTLGERLAPRSSTIEQLRAWCRQHPDLGLLTLILAVGLLFRLALLYRVPPLFMPGDSQSFLTPAYDLARGLGFDPILKRPLGYPLLVAGVIALLGEDLRGLVFIQALLGLVTIAATYWIGRLVYGRVVGGLAALSVAVGGQLLIYEHYILAESAFAMFLSLAVLAFVASARSDERHGLSPEQCGQINEPTADTHSGSSRWWLAAAGGVALAAASLFRPIAEVIVPLLPVYFLVVVRSSRRAIVLTAISIVGFALVMAPAFAADLALRGGASSGALGEHLLWRITRADSGYITRADIPPAEPDSPQAEARRYVIRKAVERTLPQEIASGLRRELGLSAAESDAVMRAVALEAIGRQPGRYLTSTARMSIELFFGEDQQLGEDSKRTGEVRYINPQARQRTWFEDRVLHLGEPPSEAVENELDRAEALTSIYQPGRVIWLIAIGFLVGGTIALFSRRYRAGILLVLAIPPMLLGSAALASPEARFRYPLDPLIAVVAFGGLVWLAEQAWIAARRMKARRIEATEPIRYRAEGSGADLG